MKRRTLAVLLAMPAVATATATVTAASAVPATASVPVRGPYLSSTPFDSTCGPQAGQVLGAFTVTVPPANADGSYDVQIKFTGNFVTLAGPSLAACNPSTGVNSGRTIREGVSGTYVTTAVLHLTSATYTGITGCPRDSTGGCNFIPYLRAAYGSGVVFNQTSLHAMLHSAAPRLTKRQLTESCSGAACASNQLTITGDIASGHAP